MNAFFWTLAIAAWLLPAGPAFAHASIAGVGGFVGGLLHPALVPAHVLGLLALGVFVVSQRERSGVLVTFAAALSIGLLCIASGVGETPAEVILLANTMLLGLFVAAAWMLPRPLALLLGAISGGALALDSPPDTIMIAEGNLMLLGTALGACIMLAIVVAAGTRMTLRWQQIGMRVLGSWIAASALLALTVQLVG